MKLNNIKKVIPLFATSFFIFSLCGCASNIGNMSSKMEISLLKVGKADAIIVNCDSQTLLIDTGEDDDGEEILENLEKMGIKKVDAMIITHFDKDHVGGADIIIEQIPVEQIYVPDYQNNNKEYLEFLKSSSDEKSAITALNSEYSFLLGTATVKIEPALSTEIKDPEEDYDNDFSMITTVSHGKNQLLFMADAEEKRIKEWLSADERSEYQFLKIPHHGKFNNELNSLFQTVKPEFSVICSSNKNPAEEKTLDLLKDYCPNIFETKDGDVTVISDGQKLTVSQE